MTAIRRLFWISSPTLHNTIGLLEGSSKHIHQISGKSALPLLVEVVLLVAVVVVLVVGVVVVGDSSSSGSSSRRRSSSR